MLHTSNDTVPPSSTNADNRFYRSYDIYRFPSCRATPIGWMLTESRRARGQSSRLLPVLSIAAGSGCVTHEVLVRGGQRSGLGVKVWPRAVETSAKIRVAGVAHGRVLGSSPSTGDSGQSPEAMSLLTCTTTVVSLVVS